MKQIVPFTKRISFDTSVDEITSISLDRKIKEINDSIISGVFNLYLEYKENDISVNVLKYESSIPFDIDIDDKYSLNDVKVEIDDFYYEIDDEEVILHIDVLIDNLEYAQEEIENIITKHESMKDDLVLSREVDKSVFEEIDDSIEETIIENISEMSKERDDDQIKIEDLFKELDEKVVDVKVEEKIPIYETFNLKNETYVTYNVHIVREDDNIDSICSKYGVTKEELSYYNDITIIKLGDKLVVPTYKK